MKMQNEKTPVNDSIERLYDALRDSRPDTIERYLAATTLFHRYSFRNTILIHGHFPDTTILAWFHAWGKRNRWGKKTSTGIAIFAPLINARYSTDAEELEPDMEREEVRKRIVTSFRVGYVFNISQTDGEPTLELFPTYGGPGESPETLLEVYRKLEIKLVFTQLPGPIQGYSLGGEVRGQDELDDSQTFRILVHELAHEMMHKDIPSSSLDRNALVETEAEAVACAVSQAFGIDHLERSADYIALHQGNLQQLTQSLARIHDTATKIIVMLEKKAGISKPERLPKYAA